MSPVPDSLTMPCGCYVRVEEVEGRREMRVSPCRFGCPNAMAALVAAAQNGVEIEFREAP